jgi:hypothetical protein
MGGYSNAVGHSHFSRGHSQNSHTDFRGLIHRRPCVQVDAKPNLERQDGQGRQENVFSLTLY